MAAYRLVYDSRHLQADCQETDQLRNPTLSNRTENPQRNFTWSEVQSTASKIYHQSAYSSAESASYSSRDFKKNVDGSLSHALPETCLL